MNFIGFEVSDEVVMLATLMSKTSVNKREQKETVAARIPLDLNAKLETASTSLRRNRSELIEFALEELLDHSPDEINKRIMRRAAKAR